MSLSMGTPSVSVAALPRAFHRDLNLGGFAHLSVVDVLWGGETQILRKLCRRLFVINTVWTMYLIWLK